MENKSKSEENDAQMKNHSVSLCMGVQSSLSKITMGSGASF